MKELNFCTTYNVVYGEEKLQFDQQKMNMFLKAVFPNLQFNKDVYDSDYLWLKKSELEAVIDVIRKYPVWLDDIISDFKLPYITEDIYRIFKAWLDKSDKDHDYVYIEWI